MKRAIAPLPMPDIVPARAEVPDPEFKWVDPRALLVEDAYQRDLGERSLRLIRRIVSAWDWRRFKPPIVVRIELEIGIEAYEVIDGQHTAIAAASHPNVGCIPVMIVTAADQATRAGAFIGHNRDRLAITKMQLHHAAVAAGDPEALTIEQVVARAGIRILRYPPSQGLFQPRDTMAIAVIGQVIDRYGALRARQILQILADAERAPIRAEDIKAVTLLTTTAEYKDSFLPEDLTLRIRTMGEEAYREAIVFAVTHKLPQWRALAVVWFKGMKRVRRTEPAHV